MKLFRSVLLLAGLVFQFQPVSHATETMTIPVDSPAFVFSPGNWTGDAGRAGKLFRQTWYPYAYFRVAWESKTGEPAAKILLDTSTYTDAATSKPNCNKPTLAYCIDGVWKSKIPCAPEITIESISKSEKHQLILLLQTSDEKERWGSSGKSGFNIVRVTGLQVNAGSVPVPDSPKPKWALIVGDSITAGIGTTELCPYSYLVGQALQTLGYEFGMSACGWSGWIRRGDNPPGDVPGYYAVSNSNNGEGGDYHDGESRWNKIDGNDHSLLDAQGHLSGYGQNGQEPALILINYGTNEILSRASPSDTRASIAQSLIVLRKSAPDTKIVLLIPFGQYYAKEIRENVEAYQKSHPQDKQVYLIDLGPELARNLNEKNGIFGGLHPNDRGHANIAARIIPQLTLILYSNGASKN